MMRASSLLPMLVVIVVVGIIVLTIPAFVTASEPQPELRPMSALLDDIRAAPQASDAVAAYARAVAEGSDRVLIDQAFIVRMVELGAPEMAEAQAANVTRNTSGDGLAWAVLAFANARRGQLEPALVQVGRAVDLAPGNRFVARTAAQLLAWYDAQRSSNNRSPDVPEARPGVSEPVDRAAHVVHKTMHSRATFVRAYDEAAGAIASAASSSEAADAQEQREAEEPSVPAVVVDGAPAPPAPDQGSGKALFALNADEVAAGGAPGPDAFYLYAPEYIGDSFCLPADVAATAPAYLDGYAGPGGAYFVRVRGGSYGYPGGYYGYGGYGHLGRGFVYADPAVISRGYYGANAVYVSDYSLARSPAARIAAAGGGGSFASRFTTAPRIQFAPGYGGYYRPYIHPRRGTHRW
jgi:hypothetical protein